MNNSKALTEYLTVVFRPVPPALTWTHWDVTLSGPSPLEERWAGSSSTGQTRPRCRDTSPARLSFTPECESQNFILISGQFNFYFMINRLLDFFFILAVLLWKEWMKMHINAFFLHFRFCSIDLYTSACWVCVLSWWSPCSLGWASTLSLRTVTHGKLDWFLPLIR